MVDVDAAFDRAVYNLSEIKSGGLTAGLTICQSVTKCQIV